MSSGETGLTTTRVPGGIFGLIEPVSMTYGVAPARRGMTSSTSRAATTDSITSQDRTSPAQRSGAGIQEFCVTAGAPLQTRVVELRSGVRLGRGDGDVVEPCAEVLGGVGRGRALEGHGHGRRDDVAVKNRDAGRSHSDAVHLVRRGLDELARQRRV